MTAPAVRVLVVDDSPTSRTLLREILVADAGIDVVGEGRSGIDAIALVRSLRPSLVVMDLRMPGMDGLVATGRIMAEQPTPIVIVTAGHDPRDVEVAMRALRVGALTVLPKPGGPGTAQFRRESAHLRSMVKALADVRVVRRRDPEAAPDPGGLPSRRAPSAPASSSAPARTVSVVAVAASTGGPVALQRLLLSLRGRLYAPVLVVQHIADGFVTGLASWLASTTGADVRVAAEGMQLQAGVTYIAPDDRHLQAVSNRRVGLSDAPAVGGFRPSASVLLRTVAETYGMESVALILTGMGTDGLEGARAVRSAGGLVLAQDEASSAVFGMPKAVVDAGLASDVGPVDVLASRWLRQ